MFYILPQMLSFVAKIFVFPDFIGHVVKQLDKKAKLILKFMMP